MSPPTGVSEDTKNAFYDWVDERVLQNIKYTEPEIFSWIVDRGRELIAHAADRAAAELGA
jgi:hypothetical protein